MCVCICVGGCVGLDCLSLSLSLSLKLTLSLSQGVVFGRSSQMAPLFTITTSTCLLFGYLAHDLAQLYSDGWSTNEYGLHTYESARAPY